MEKLHDQMKKKYEVNHNLISIIDYPTKPKQREMKNEEGKKTRAM